MINKGVAWKYFHSTKFRGVLLSKWVRTAPGPSSTDPDHLVGGVRWSSDICFGKKMERAKAFFTTFLFSLTCPPQILKGSKLPPDCPNPLPKAFPRNAFHSPSPVFKISLYPLPTYLKSDLSQEKVIYCGDTLEDKVLWWSLKFPAWKAPHPTDLDNWCYTYS